MPLRRYIKKDAARALASEASSRYGVSTPIILGVIEHESSFNITAQSHVGAQGLMQLMPSVQRQYGVTDPYDPRQNIMAGTKHLAGYIKRYGGRLQYGLAAYNRGPGNVPADEPLDARSMKYVRPVLAAASKYGAGVGGLLLVAAAAFLLWRYFK